MNLDELKSAWQVYDQKLQASQGINEKIILSMIRERSSSRVSKIKRNNTFLMAVMLLELLILGAIFIGNPFDFDYKWQFVPYIFLSIGVMMAIGVLFENYKMLNIEINNNNLKVFLENVINGYEKNRKAEKWFGLTMLIAACLTILSFLPHKLAKYTLSIAIIDTIIPLVISLGIYFIAFKLGAFKDPKREGFKEDLKELKELSADLKEA